MIEIRSYDFRDRTKSLFRLFEKDELYATVDCLQKEGLVSYIAEPTEEKNRRRKESQIYYIHPGLALKITNDKTVVPMIITGNPNFFEEGIPIICRLLEEEIFESEINKKRYPK